MNTILTLFTLGEEGYDLFVEAKENQHWETLRGVEKMHLVSDRLWRRYQSLVSFKPAAKMIPYVFSIP